MRGPNPQKIKCAQRKNKNYIFSYFYFSHSSAADIISAAAKIASVISEFDIFAHRPVQTSVLVTIETAYIPIAPVEKNDLEFFIPADNNTYIDLDIKVYDRSKLFSGSGKDVDFTDLTGLKNNFLHSLFSQSNVTLNGVTITQAIEQYHYRSYVETLMTYGTDAAASLLLKRLLVFRHG